MEVSALELILKSLTDPVYVVLVAVIFWLMKMLRDRDKLMFGYVEKLAKITTLLNVLVRGKRDGEVINDGR